MTSFDARIRLMGHSGLPLGVEIDLSYERMRVTAGNSRIADWSLEEIQVTELSDGFHINAEDEEIVLSVVDPTRFAAALGLAPETGAR